MEILMIEAETRVIKTEGKILTHKARIIKIRSFFFKTEGKILTHKARIIKTEGKILTHKARIIKIEGKILTHKAYPEIPFYHMFLRKLCQIMLLCHRVTLSSMQIFIDRPLTISSKTTTVMILEIKDIIIIQIRQACVIMVTTSQE